MIFAWNKLSRLTVKVNFAWNKLSRFLIFHFFLILILWLFWNVDRKKKILVYQTWIFFLCITCELQYYSLYKSKALLSSYSYSEYSSLDWLSSSKLLLLKPICSSGIAITDTFSSDSSITFSASRDGNRLYRVSQNAFNVEKCTTWSR